MKPSKIFFLKWSLGVLGGLCVPFASFAERDASPPPKVKESLIRVTDYLWSKQSPDGSWRSETYGLLKSGQSLTPFILFVLSEVRNDMAPPPEGAVEKSMNFLRRMGNKNSIHGRADPHILDYPNYATSYALRCFLRYGQEDDKTRIDALARYLVLQQFAEAAGFSPDSPAYGGWGFGINQRPTLSSFVDLSHTRRVLAALDEANKVDAEIKSRALCFLSLVQKSPKEIRSPLIPTKSLMTSGFIPPPYDGGFFSSPNVSYANKGRIAKNPLTGRPYYRSYATATCDGILALLATGIPQTDDRVLDAVRWLERHSGWDLPSGIPAEHSEPWAESMIYYHCAARAQVFYQLAIAEDWRKNLRTFLAERQNEDGSFLNPQGRLMKEDDPILCSALALIALNQAAMGEG